MTNIETPSSAEPPSSQPPPPRQKPKRPALIVVGLALGAFRFGREFLSEFFASRFGFFAGFVPVVVLVAGLVTWRMLARRRARGGEEYTPEQIIQQVADSGLPGPAFEEDGSLRGSSILVVNQRPKLLEVITEYRIFGADGTPRGSIRQIAQGKLRRAMRLLTPFDQFFTHHFEIFDGDGALKLRVTRPRKFFRTKVNVFDQDDRFLGRVRQENIFFKIRFVIEDPAGVTIGRLHAENWRAWDFQFLDAAGREVGRVVKSWEGMAKAVFTQADLYVMRVHEQLPEPLRTMVVATALSIDLALKQDPQGLNG